MGQVRVGGIYGVGKTTVIKACLAGFSEDGIHIPLIKGSEIMARILGIPVDQLPAQSNEARTTARAAMYKEIGEMASGVRDAHFSTVDQYGNVEYPRSEIDVARVTALALVTARPKIIARRRTQIGRPFRPSDLSNIIEHQALEQEAAARLSAELDVPLHMIENNNEDPSLAADLLKQILAAHCL
ncbi:hypothetical protein IFM12275_41180 [Nocardia sputorum]|uniref:hypothetical protein n=1 Tax=Nocardia TaxID=1817 RepID=UPI002456B059|nr:MULTISPECIES: hypothetical protein [Nocardia]BDT94142.1 hypothetical protein IFM12275_41180 [Nocardia sputorum]